MDYELIFWCVLGIIALIFVIPVFFVKDDRIEITWGQRRDWERQERKWK